MSNPELRIQAPESTSSGLHSIGPGYTRGEGVKFTVMPLKYQHAGEQTHAPNTAHESVQSEVTFRVTLEIPKVPSKADASVMVNRDSREEQALINRCSKLIKRDLPGRTQLEIDQMVTFTRDDSVNAKPDTIKHCWHVRIPVRETTENIRTPSRVDHERGTGKSQAHPSIPTWIRQTRDWDMITGLHSRLAAFDTQCSPATRLLG